MDVVSSHKRFDWAWVLLRSNVRFAFGLALYYLSQMKNQNLPFSIYNLYLFFVFCFVFAFSYEISYTKRVLELRVYSLYTSMSWRHYFNISLNVYIPCRHWLMSFTFISVLHFTVLFNGATSDPPPILMKVYSILNSR